MRDLLIITPSRGRPDRLKAMLDAALSLSEADTHVAVGVDDDDPALAAYDALGTGERFFVTAGPRGTVSGWTNHLAQRGLGQYRAFCCMGDDHLPKTQGWDRLLLEAIDGMGGTGFAYGDDNGQRELLATSVVISADIVQALGWAMLPTCAHYHVDDAWMTLGKEAGCLAWCPHVLIPHVHPAWGGPWDETYATEAPRGGADQAAWSEWWHGPGRASDVAKVAALVAGRKAAC